jgi:hypothetical protein
MDENVSLAIVVGNEAKAFPFVEPLDSTAIHNVPPEYMLSQCKNKSHGNVSQKWKLTYGP